jgi:putative membrane protein
LSNLFNMYNYYPMHEVGHYGFGGEVFGFVILGLLIALAVILVRHFVGGHSGRSSCSSHRSSDAMTILRERYAKGEIDSKEYEERKTILSK